VLGWLLRGRDLDFLLFGFDAFAWWWLRLLLQAVSTLHVVVTMLSVWQEHTAIMCDAYLTIEVDSCTFVYF